MTTQFTGGTNTVGREKAIIILGIDRSGTSATAGLVHHWGAFGGDACGPDETALGDHGGFYETTAFFKIHDEISRLVCGRLGDLAETFDTDVLNSKLIDIASDPELAQRASELVQGMRQSNGAPWYWKEPVLSLLLPFWMKFWGDAAYIITVRNPEDSARSWNKFVRANQLREVVDPTAANIIRWQVYLLAILRDTQHVRSKLFVSYESLMEKPATQCERIASFLNMHTGREFDNEVVSSMIQSVDGKLWRNRSHSEFAESLHATTE